MDEIQKALIKAGRKDLAQEYYENVFKKKAAVKKTIKIKIPSFTFWAKTVANDKVSSSDDVEVNIFKTDIEDALDVVIPKAIVDAVNSAKMLESGKITARNITDSSEKIKIYFPKTFKFKYSK